MKKMIIGIFVLIIIISIIVIVFVVSNNKEKIPTIATINIQVEFWEKHIKSEVN